MSTPPTNAEADAAVPVAGTPVRSLTNAFLKDCISTFALKLNLSAVAAAVQTWLATPSSANLFSALTTKTGSGGSAVFSTGPTISALTTTGLTTADGASITTASVVAIAGNAGVVTTSNLFNTISNGADTSITFSGAPASSNTWFYMAFTNSDGSNARTFTIPSGYSLARQTLITTFILGPSQFALIQVRWTGARYEYMGDPVPLAYKGIEIRGGDFDTVVDGTYEVILSFPFACNMVSVATDADSGTCNLTVRNVTQAATATGTAAVSSTKATQALSGSVAVAAGDTLAVILAANSSCLGLRATIWVAPASV